MSYLGKHNIVLDLLNIKSTGPLLLLRLHLFEAIDLKVNRLQVKGMEK